ncbi:MAG: fibronectin type III domain-containing protein, partial [Candidatus Nanopelagicales bacterium]
PHTLTGLVNGHNYTIYARAVNTIGTGPWSTGTLVTPQGPPGVLTGVAAAPGNTTASVSWTVDDTGGSAVTRIEFALDDTVTVDDSTSNVAGPHTLTGLVNGHTYTVYVRAVNTIGAGPWSTGTPVTPQAPAPPTPPTPAPSYPPGPPVSVTAVAGNAAATVAWTAPADPGSFPVSTYQVTSSPEGRSCMTSALTCEVSGLTTGTAYTFTVRALNAAGWGPSSAPSAAVTPQATPKPSILITGSRTGSTIRVDGTTSDLTGTLTPWIRFPSQTTFTEGYARLTITDNAFTWSRKSNKKTHIYFTHGTVQSNTITIAAR